MSDHELKIWPKFFRLVAVGMKNFELRKDDRHFGIGDTLRLREWDPDSKKYTNRMLERRVLYVLRDAEEFGLRPGFCILSLEDNHE